MSYFLDMQLFSATSMVSKSIYHSKQIRRLFIVGSIFFPEATTEKISAVAENISVTESFITLQIHKEYL